MLYCCIVVLLQVSGLLGPAARLEKKGPQVADQEVGQGGTTQWRMCGVDYDSTVALFFEITATADKGSEATAQVRACPGSH